MDDARLLRRYVEERADDAFAELVRRHLGLVYHAALRQTHGDAALAGDVTQAVFTDLARRRRRSPIARCSRAGSTRARVKVRGELPPQFVTVQCVQPAGP